MENELGRFNNLGDRDRAGAREIEIEIKIEVEVKIKVEIEVEVLRCKLGWTRDSIEIKRNLECQINRT